MYQKLIAESDLHGRTASDKVLLEKAFNVDKNLKYDGYQSDLAEVVYNFFEKKSSELMLLMVLLHMLGQRLLMGKINLLLKIKFSQPKN